MCACLEEPEKKPEALGLEDPSVWGDAADNVSANLPQVWKPTLIRLTKEWCWFTLFW